MAKLFRGFSFILFVVCTTLAAMGQEPEGGGDAESEEIETDRDSFTPATTTVGLGRGMFETSYTCFDNRNVPEGHSFPETLLRLGVFEPLEFRIGWNYETGGPPGATDGVEPGQPLTENESSILYGVKLRTSRQNGWIPASAVIVQGYTPTSGPSDFTRVTVGEVVGWKFANGWQWDSALRYGTQREEEDDFHQWAPSTVLKVPVGERWSVHAEYFGILVDGKEEGNDQHYASPGVHVMLTENIELGVRVGFGLTEETPRFFNNVGLGWSF